MKMGHNEIGQEQLDQSIDQVPPSFVGEAKAALRAHGTHLLARRELSLAQLRKKLEARLALLVMQRNKPQSVGLDTNAMSRKRTKDSRGSVNAAQSATAKASAQVAQGAIAEACADSERNKKHKLSGSERRAGFTVRMPLVPLSEEHQAWIVELVEEFQARNWQSDSRYAEMKTRSLRNRGKGPLAIREQLQRDGIEKALSKQNLEISESDLSWKEQALSSLRRKFARQTLADDPKFYNKAVRFLLSRGFESSDVRLALKEFNLERGKESEPT